MVLVATQLSVPGLYLPPVIRRTQPGLQYSPPQTIISLPVHTAAGSARPDGALVVLVATQLSVPGLYLPPLLTPKFEPSSPPQTIISLPVHTAVCFVLAEGALIVLVAVQLSVLGLYLPPVFSATPL